MKAGDLVQMKYIAFWMKKTSKHGVPYTEEPFLVYEVSGNAIKVMLPDGRIKSDLKEYWDVVSESQ